MLIRVPFFLRLCLFLLLSVLASCSWFRHDVPSEARKTIIAVTDSYLRYIATGNERQLNSYVLWEDFLNNSHPKLTHEEYHPQLLELQNRWTPVEHPLLGLQVLDVDIDGNDALIRLRKNKRPDFPEIWVRYFWSGSAWLVVEDSIFGKEKLAGQLGARPVYPAQS